MNITKNFDQCIKTSTGKSWRAIALELSLLTIGAVLTIQGLAFLVAPWSESVRNFLGNILVNHGIFLSFLGFSAILVGPLWICLYIIAKKLGSISLSNSDNDLTEEDDDEVFGFLDVFNHYVDSYWEEIFPTDEVLSEVFVDEDGVLVIQASLPFVEKQKKNSMIVQIEKDLNALVRGLVDENQEGEATVRVKLAFPDKPPRMKLV